MGLTCINITYLTFYYIWIWQRSLRFRKDLPDALSRSSELFAFRNSNPRRSCVHLASGLSKYCCYIKSSTGRSKIYILQLMTCPQSTVCNIMLAACVAKAVKPLPVIKRRGVVLLRSTHALIQALTLPQSPPRSLVAHASKPAR